MGIAIKNSAPANFAASSTRAIVDALSGAMQQLNEVQEQWNRLIRFWSELDHQTYLIQRVRTSSPVWMKDAVSRSQVILEFIALITQALSDELLDPVDREVFSEILFLKVIEIDRGSRLLVLMAKTYIDVSNEYLLGQVVGLTDFLYLQTDAERNTHLQILANKRTGIPDRVKEIVDEQVRMYQAESLRR